MFFVATSATLKRGIKEAQTEDAYYKVVELNYRFARGRSGIENETLNSAIYLLRVNANKLSVNDVLMIEVTN